jgi:hypothetical protein
MGNNKMLENLHAPNLDAWFFIWQLRNVLKQPFNQEKSEAGKKWLQ